MKRSSLFAGAALVALAVSCRSPSRGPGESGPVVGAASTATDPASASTSPQFDADRPTMSVKGKVVETFDVARYTYFSLETDKGRVWAAVPKTRVQVGASVVVEQAVHVEHFKSPTLNRDFDDIYFGVLPRDADAATVAANGTAASDAAGGASPDAARADASPKVEKASGADAKTIAEVFEGADKLKGRGVTIQGTVVKVNDGILGKNWVHLQDGTGTEPTKDNDLLVTSEDTATVGDIVIVTGKVATDRDIGAGYRYKVLVEEATIKVRPVAKGH